MRAHCKLCEKLGSNGKRLSNGFYICSSCRSQGPPDELRCKGNNTAGKRCGQWALQNSDYCTVHKGKEGENETTISD